LQTNCDTGEPLAEPNTQRIVWVIDRLQLTPQQLHAIAQGAAVARKLLTPLLEELKELQLQQGGEDTSHHASCSNGLGSEAFAAGADAAAAAGGGNAVQQQQPLQQQQQDAAALGQLYARSVAYRQSLLLQQERSDRMKLLMRKVS
jgi:hypothetical protein